MSASPDPDLRDVFHLLYDDDDEDEAWGDFGSDGDGDGALDVDAVEADIEPDASTKYTRKRFRALIDDLFLPYSQSSKRQRIYTPPIQPVSILTPILSTSSLPLATSSAVYAPFSPYALLARLQTYTPASFPSSLSATKLARNGWICSGRETLSCGACGSSWSVKGVDEIDNEKIRLEVARRLGESANTRHRQGCAWKVRDTPDDVGPRISTLLHPMISSSLAPLAERIQHECLSEGPSLRWKSPLTDKQLARLVVRLDAYVDADESDSPTPLSHLSTSHSSPTSISRLSTTSITNLSAALALFAWYPYHSKTSTPLQIDRSVPPKRTEIVQCRICQRRVGLWAFKGDVKREMDVCAEHLAWCPVRQEGWWETAGLLKENKVEWSGGQWISLSDKLEKKSWRRL
ncbi:C3HC zinc finger-like-domain-containing protein [Naematelia encephala]|uniref:C3HC zinc finger-like-domain-containing protein n=1 Tax=Naematelia encephala TaxID=71784 RepID=A0A1Y2AUT7_9TREE|nr:C3HC zinc finger-like-domain-containing protein [Naematelia encephala]